VSFLFLLDKDLESLLVLIVISSMIITPFFISRITAFVDSFIKDDFVQLEIVGKFVATHLDELGAPYVIIDNSPKHVKEAMDEDKEVYLGDMSKKSILEALNVKESVAVIVTLDNLAKKRLICEEILKVTNDINLIVKVVSLEEKEALSDLDITVIVDGKLEVGRVLVERMITCQLKI